MSDAFIIINLKKDIVNYNPALLKMFDNIEIKKDDTIDNFITNSFNINYIDTIKNYIDKALTENKTVNNFTFKNITNYLNEGAKAANSRKILQRGKTFRPLKQTQSVVHKKLVSDVMKKNNPELHQLISSQSQFIKSNPKVLNIEIKDFIENINNIKNKQIQENLSKGNQVSELRILKGKLNLGPKDFAISQAQDTYVKELNENIKQQVKEIGYNEWIKRNPDLVEYSGKRIDSKTGEIIQRSPEELKKYINKGFFSIDHKNKKSGEKINIEFPTNKQIVPNGVNSGYIRSAQSYLKNNIDKLIVIKNSRVKTYLRNQWLKQHKMLYFIQQLLSNKL
jgi:hypothetical protein